MVRPGRIDDVHVRSAGQKGLGIYSVVGWIQNSGVEAASTQSSGAHSAVFADLPVRGSRIEDLLVAASGCDHAVEADGGQLRIGGVDVRSDPVNAVYSVPATTIWSRSHVYPFHYSGELALVSGVFRMPVLYPVMILAIRAIVDTAPIGADIILDVNLNGTTIFPTSTPPTIPDGANISALAFPDVVHLVSSDYLTIDIDQVGSTTIGSNLTVVVLVEPHKT